MNKIVSYKTKILYANKVFDDTLKVYRDALSFLIEVFNDEWIHLSALSNKDLNNQAEKFVHSTKNNKAKYQGFDKHFYKLPSYFRRGAISEALGIVSSYQSNLQNFISKKSADRGHKPPVLQLKHFSYPVFYKKEQYKYQDEKLLLKIYKNNDWIWYPVELRQQDLNYLKRNGLNDPMSPTLEKKGRHYYLRFSFKVKCEFKTNASPKVKEIQRQKIVAVDLNLNTSAVCSIMQSDGTVTDRLFINQPVEKDQMKHALNRLRKKQYQGGRYGKPKKLWAKINNLNRSIAEQTALGIINFAQKHDVDVIVFENLNFSGKSRFQKNKRQRLQMWNKLFIQNIVTSKAHRIGVRINTINPSNTSILAYDGSGYVVRDTTNYAQCTFPTGKTYNTDLNASYNIGARYFLKVYTNALKTSSAKKWSLLVAKVPQLERRTKCTLSTLINFNVVLSGL